MNPLDSFLLEIEQGLPVAAVDPETWQGIGIADIAIDMPVESRIDRPGILSLSSPRGRLATGFDPYLGRLRVYFVRGRP